MKYLTVEQVAEDTGFSYEHVRRNCHSFERTGEGLEAYKPGKEWRIPETAVDRWVRGEPTRRLRAAG